MVFPSYSGLPLVSNHQGGICGESTSDDDLKTFAISFKKRCYIMNAVPKVKHFRDNGWAKPVNQSKFVAGIGNDMEGFYRTNAVDYIAIGI